MESATLISIGAIFALLVLSAFFSGSETALTAASRPRLHRLETEGNRRAAIVNHLRLRRDRLIGAILLGNNLVNIVASVLATSILIGVFGKAGPVYASVVMTLLVLIFAEVLPKTYAIHRPEGVALVVAPVLRILVIMLAPVTRAIELVVRGTLRLFGVRLQHEPGMVTTEEELRGAIELHKGPEPEVPHERRMLRSILDLADVEVGEIMIHRSSVAMVDGDLPTGDVVEQVLASPYTRVPVWRGEPDNIVGVIHSKELFRAARAAGANLDKVDLEKIAAPPWFIPEATALLDQMHEFRNRHEHFALVVDEYGSLMGVVTLEDILEEIVGEIADEHDLAVSGVRPQPDGSYLVNGDVTIRDLNREFEWRLPDRDAATVAGLVMHEAQRIPEVGQVFAFHGFRFEILRRRKNRIALIRIATLQSQHDSETA